MIIGEGLTEKAFLEHLKTLYIQRGCGVSVKIQAANGGSPESIFDYANSVTSQKAYDRKAVLMDTDREWKSSLIKRANQKKINLIGSTPCIEGLILEILDLTIPHESDKCKTECSKQFKGKLTDKNTYQEKLSYELLEKKRSSVELLDNILSYYSL